MRLKLILPAATGGTGTTINDKNLKYEIETMPIHFPCSQTPTINDKNLKYEIETKTQSDKCSIRGAYQ